MTEIIQSEGVLGGKPRIKGTRVSVKQVQEMYDRNDMTPEEIAEILPTVTVQNVKTAIQHGRGESLE